MARRLGEGRSRSLEDWILLRRVVTPREPGGHILPGALDEDGGHRAADSLARRRQVALEKNCASARIAPQLGRRVSEAEARQVVDVARG